MKELMQRRNAMAAAVLITTAVGSSGAFAFGSQGIAVDQFCANSGNTLKAEFMPQVEDNCTACHDNGPGGGSGAGKTARKNGNFEFFCPPATPPQTCTDADGDGFNAEGGMCGPKDLDDTNAAVFPGAPEICTDGVDNDGNGLVDKADPNAINCPTQCTDMDGDTYSIEGRSCGPIDCNDNDASINPGAEESCSDGIDHNCNGKVDAADPNAVGCPVMCTDNDGDGYSIEGGVCGAMDCNDSDPNLNPGAMEICGDGIDNNCDARIDAADSTCQAMDNDDALKDKHDRARQKSETCEAEYEQFKKEFKLDRIKAKHNDDDDRDEDADKKSRKHKRNRRHKKDDD